MTAKIESKSEEICDNRIITLAMADDYWTRHILEVCINDGTSGAFDTSIDVDKISVEGDAVSGITFESDDYDEDTLFLAKMSVINGNNFWTSDTMTNAETQAKILFDSGYTYPEVKEALALVDFREVNHSLLGTMSAKNTTQDSYNR